MNAEAGTMRLDPISLTVIWNTLVSIAEEMGGALRRTAFSEAVREGQDFSTGLFDAQARLVVQGNFTPGHLGAMPYVVKNVLEFIPPASLVPGDMIVTNDSFLGGGHFPDFFFVAPVYDGTTLIGYVVNTAHHVDVGGRSPGSQSVQGTPDCFSEGMRVMPVKLVREGEFEADLLRTILANVRLPEKVRGDFLAQRNANHVGAERLRNLFAQNGAAVMTQAIEEILDRSEARARELIAKIPKGHYSFDDQMDDYGPDTPAIPVCVDVTIDESGATVDFSRSGDQVPAGLNCYINYTRAYASFALRIFAQIDVPNNAGVERVIKTVAREGCFFNAIYPAASGGRASIQVRIFDAINGALSAAVPKLAMGGFSHWGNPNLGGFDSVTGKPWIMYDLIFGGYGGRASRDGVEGMAPVMNCANVPVEVHETNNPIRIHRLELLPDTGGIGQNRGGCALRKDVELLCDEATLSLLGDRHKNPPYGIFGGGPGACAQTILIREGQETALGSKEVRLIQKGDVISFRVAGGGGYGNPKDRERRRILDDVRDGYVSRSAAVSLYGIEDIEMESGLLPPASR